MRKRKINPDDEHKNKIKKAAYNFVKETYNLNPKELFTGPTAEPKKSIPSLSIAQRAVAIVAFICALIVSYGGYDSVVRIAKLYTVQCPYVNNRLCNGRGQCINGICHCSKAFSGISCSDQQIPGYNLKDNTVCNNNGYLIEEFLYPIQECDQIIVAGTRVGQGWANQNCSFYVQAVRRAIDLVDDPRIIAEYFTIPVCNCKPKYGGIDCSEILCPTDVSGNICGASTLPSGERILHGNTSVGILYNYTNAGVGCQCKTPITLNDPFYISLIGPERYQEILDTNEKAFNEIYCGTFIRYNTTNSTGGAEYSFLALSTAADYQCFCSEDWRGATCTESRCPGIGSPCSAHGAKNKGLGYLPNTTLAVNRGLPCTVHCTEGKTSCSKNRCITTQTRNLELFTPSPYCDVPYVCPLSRPVRCYDGSCQPIPGIGSHGCVNRYTVGSIDHGRLDVPLREYVCANITNLGDFTACFENTTELVGVVTGYIDTGGFVVSSASQFTFDLGSPLIYFQFTTNTTNGVVSVETWDGQGLSFFNQELVSGFFQYTEKGNWITVTTTGRFNLQRNLDLDFVLCPLEWNYTGGGEVPANFSVVRISQSSTQVKFILDLETDYLRLKPYVDETYLVIKAPIQNDEQLWFHPATGGSVPETQCLANPSFCSFHRTDEDIRTLDFSYYLCSSGGEPILQPEPCSIDLVTLIIELEGYLYAWDTCGVVASSVSITLLDAVYDTLERDYPRSSFPITISFVNFDTNFSSILDPVFLTLERVTYPCACPGSLFEANQTTLNEEWFNQGDLRSPNLDTTNVLDWVLFALYDTGIREIKRGIVQSVNDESSVFKILEPWTGVNYTVYSKDVRSISPVESLRGWSDGDLFFTPFRCPNGYLSTAEVDYANATATSNCTANNLGIVQCSFTDPTLARWGCDCNITQQICQCGFPATPSFELDLLARFNTLLTIGCQGILFTPSVTDVANYSVTVENINSNWHSLLFSTEQQPTQLVIKTATCDPSPQFTLYIGSQLFSNLTFGLDFENSTNATCEYWLSLQPLAPPAWNNITVYSTHTISWITVLFSTYGFSLTNFYPQPIYSASSNSAQAKNVNLGNGSYWVSSGSLHEIPVYIQMDMPQPSIVDHMTIDFYVLGYNNIQNRVYVQGYANNSWYGLGSVSGYVAEGGWLSFTLLIEYNVTFESFRLVTQAGRFGVRHWGVFANQQWSCFDNSNLILRADSLEGLQSISVLLEEIAFFQENVNTLDCLAINNCTIRVGIDNSSLIQVARDGKCQDVYYMGSLAGLPRRRILANTITIDIVSIFQLDTVNFLPGINAVQFTNSSEFLLSSSQLEEFYGQYLTGFLTPFFNNQSYNSTVYFYYNLNNSIILFNQSSLTEFYIENATFITQQYQYEWGNLLTDQISCPTGYDQEDCGPSSRNIPYMPGVGCTLNYAQNELANLILNASVLVNKTYFTSNFSQLASWTALFYNVQLNRTYLPITLQNCPGQLCEGVNSYMCLDGSCVQFPEDCNEYYTCPGNGCIEETDASILGNAVYSCNCEPGRNGDACQYGTCVPATPEFQNGIPAAEECTCGGPPPLTLKPQLRNLLETIQFRVTRLNIPKLIALNNRITASSAPKSTLQVANLNILPKSGSWGTQLRIPRRVVTSPLLSNAQSTFWSTCPFARKGFHGEPKYLDDDKESENPVTGAPVWKVYTNPFTGETSIYPWSSPYAYDDFPWRCANSFCVAQKSDCAAVEALYPLCNGRGTCMSDGFCQCFPGWKTFMANEQFSISIQYPYFVVDGIPDSTIWETNWNSVFFGLNQCNTRDCDAIDCTPPVGCFPGTPELDFADALTACDQSTGKAGLCAPSEQDCINGLNLSPALVCSGRGIPRKKDFTNEQYCACGTPVSDQVTTGELSEITQLVPNGWGGPNCDQYYATSSPIYWSSFDFLNNLPYRSKITNEILPGKWVSGNRIIGPDPADKILWDQCCGGFDRLEKCDTVPCSVQGQIQCVSARTCQAPLVYPCNNHGTALADGTCECSVDVQAGTGYTADFTQFSDKGCYKLLQCPDCNIVPACTEPAEWRHPLPYDIGINQQWYSCIQGLGLYSNETLINELSSSVNQRRDLILQGLTQIAIRTQRSISDLASCICVYPNDTASVKTGMIAGTEYRYKQNYRSPYNLSGDFPGYPLLTDNTLQYYPVEVYDFSAGDSFYFKLGNPDLTYISAVRIWGVNLENTTQVQLSSNGVEVCPAITLNYNGDVNSYWIAGSNFAFQCGPTYECYNFKVEERAAYDANCAIPGSSECLNWQYSTCSESALRVVWPLDSQAQYQGCARNAFASPCTCCVRLSDPLTPVENGIINVTILSGSAKFGQMRIYGYTEEALETPPILLSVLQANLGTTGDASTCQDRDFFAEAIPTADGNPFVPVQNVTTYPSAFRTCMSAGGYLATTVSSGSDQENIRALQRQCKDASERENDKCFVSAYDTRYFTEYTNRSEMIQDNCQTCFMPGEVYPAGGFRPISFSVYPAGLGTTYQTPTFALDQISSFAALQNILNVDISDFVAESLTSFRYTKRFGQQRKRVFNRKTTADCTIRFQFPENYIIEGAPQQNFLFKAGNMEVWTEMYKWVSTIIPVFNYNMVWDSVTTSPNGCAAIRFYDQNDYVSIQNGQPISKTNPVFQIEKRFFEQNSVFKRCGQYDPNARDNVGNQYKKICTSEIKPAYMMFFPTELPTYYEMVLGASTTRITGDCTRVVGGPETCNTIGDYGKNFLPGIEGWPYLPVFMTIAYKTRYDLTWYEGGVPLTPLLDNNTPVYFTKLIDEVNDISFWYTPVTISSCRACIKTLDPVYIWDQYIYSQNQWLGDFNPGIKDNVQLLIDGTFVNLSTAPVPYLAHQVTYIESRANTAASVSRSTNPNAITWYINNCLIIGASGFEAVVCDQNLYNFVCLYDFTKYTVVPGYQCPPCGTGSRSGGTPAPGITCFSEFPLANASANPTSHAILLSWQQGTLPIYADSFNLPTDTIDFMNRSTIWGLEKAYLFWAQDLSNRPGQASAGVTEVLNWCDLSLTRIWPVDCGIQVNPNTNERQRACAVNLQLCPWFAQVGENAVIRPEEVPPIFANADPSTAATNPTCGSTVRLQSYAKMDKYGGIQDDLDLYVVFLQLTSDYVQFQFNASSNGRWYNSAKTTTKWVFESGTTSTVAGRYLLEGCDSCILPTMEVFLHPLSPEGTFPTTIISYNLTLQNDAEIAYEIPFTVSTSNTGSYVVGGQTFPAITFQGVGYRFYNMSTGSSITLYNPILSNNATIAACLNKTTVTYYEPKPKIISTAPLRQCLLKEADLIYFPGKKLGECGCDLSSAGRSCQCPSVVSKYGPEVCGGFGDEGTGIQVSTGEIITTGTGSESGCFNFGGVSGCKTVEIGRSMYTLLTPLAVWDYPSVFISTSPQSGDGLFINPENTISSYFTYEEIQDECTLEASFVAYYLTADELNQMAVKNLLLPPFFIAVTNSTNPASLPWEGLDDLNYFINGAGTTTTVFSSDSNIDCDLDAETAADCLALNIGNYAYTGSPKNAINDGNAEIVTSFGSDFNLNYTVTAPLEVLVYVFRPNLNTEFITCYGGGFCNARVPKGNNAQFTCRCPARAITILAGSYAEIQIFDSNDQTRVTAYKYN